VDRVWDGLENSQIDEFRKHAEWLSLDSTLPGYDGQCICKKNLLDAFALANLTLQKPVHLQEESTTGIKQLSLEEELRRERKKRKQRRKSIHGRHKTASQRPFD